ncbi:PilW family protein [Pandoraea pulmonicola]|uniref:Tfp pilus assembly protein PilW n=1 Tax=Pandoraea pulmonicola TaxID=93221 RepID=A0AAJ4ZFL2_PANPU|nr:PilW family protein [Pandoraea pulmonicola]AJC19517.1 hypothetical protein RO07_01685 [Pandoraea pulmonicola]SUA92424.1 Tfp pilus assembly protein PilW [Pandoraea pulmonicola]
MAPPLGKLRVRTPHTPHTPRMAGFTLLECVVAMPLGLLIVMAATAIYLAGLRLWRTQAERYDVNERAVFALTQLSRAVAIAGYRNWDPIEGGLAPSTGGGRRDWPSIRASAECAGAVDNCPRRGWQGSSLLEVQYHGAGFIKGNGAVQNCAGHRAIGIAQTDMRHRSHFYVDKGDDGVPSLFCRYGDQRTLPPKLHPGQVLVSGVEAMYIRLGFRAGSSGALRWVDPVKSARRKPPVAPRGEGGWENVAAVAISLVMRGAPRRGGKARATRVVEVFDASSGGRDFRQLSNAGDVHLHVFNAVVHRRNDGGIGEVAPWLASSW